MQRARPKSRRAESNRKHKGRSALTVAEKATVSHIECLALNTPSPRRGSRERWVGRVRLDTTRAAAPV